MATKDLDRNLLFGILAFQIDFISREALVSAMHAWVLAKDKPLGEILVEQEALSADRRTLLEALVAEHLKQHGNDPQQSLAAVGSLGSVEEELKQLGDGDVNATLASAATVKPAQSWGNRATTVGSSTSSGARFRILRPHAEGGLGKVSVARDEELAREVALKEIKELHADHPESRARFMLEAEITGGLEHPGIVPVYGLGQYADGRPYYAMRFIRGDSLKEAVDRYHDPNAEKANPGERAIELRKLLGRFLDVCNAIAYAHSRGVLHRDLKPGNIMLGKYGETLVVDWGLAKAADRKQAASESAEGLLRPVSGDGVAATQMGSTLGTPQYMSPEQAAGRLDLLGPASDVYSLGATLYYVLTGQPPIAGKDIGTVLRMVQQGVFRPPRAINPAIAPPLQAICLKAMALKPKNRYPSPKAMADDIDHWLADEPVTAYRDPLLARASRLARRHKVASAALAALLLAAVIGLSLGNLLLGREQARTDVQRRRAETALAETETARGAAEVNFQSAKAEAQKSQRQLAMLDIERGVNELQNGDHLRGMAILGQAYRAAVTADDAGLRRNLCSLLGVWHEAIERSGFHGAEVRAAAFTRDGKRLVTAGDDGTARTWDVSSGEPLGEPVRLRDSRCAAFSPDGRKLATASWQKTVCVCDPGSGRLFGTPIQLAAEVELLVFSPDGAKLATVTLDKTVRLWNAASGEPLGEPMRHEDKVTSIVFSADGTKLASATGDILRKPVTTSGAARLWDAASGRPLTEPMRHDGAVLAIALSPDGTKLATGSEDRTARLWDAVDGKPLAAPLQHGAPVGAVAFSPDGKTFAAGSIDGAVRLYDAAGGKPLVEPMKFYEMISHVVFSPDGTQLAVAGLSGKIMLWDVVAGTLLAAPMKHRSSVFALVFNPDGSKLATAGRDGTARLWDATAGVPLTRPMVHEAAVWRVAFSPDGAKLAAASGVSEITSSGELRSAPAAARLWDAVAGTMLVEPMRHRFRVSDVAFSPDGTKLATASWDNTARLWDAATGKPLGEPMKHDFMVNAVAFSPDGTKVATASADKTARLWDAASGKPLARPMKHDRLVQAVAFSPDGKTLATMSGEQARLWDAASGEPLAEPIKHDGIIRALAFSPDGRKLATAGGLNPADPLHETARLWNVADGKPLAKPMKQDRNINGLAFSPDGTKLATAGGDLVDGTGGAQLWEIGTGKPVGEPMINGDVVVAVAFSPDGTILATAGRLGILRLWDVVGGKSLAGPLENGGPTTAIAFSPDGTKLAVATGRTTSGWVVLWPVPRPLPDDPRWVAAFVGAASGWQEDGDGHLAPLSPADFDDAWQTLLRSPGRFNEQRTAAERRDCLWHEMQADRNQAAGRWFGAAFHLRWLVAFQPRDSQWKRRLAAAEEQLKGDVGPPPLVQPPRKP
jgi:WD40 repeat protein/serine/threonine protein kinase